MANGHRLIEDFNADEMVGVGYNHTTTRGGERMSAWTSFVAPVLDHPDLTVSTGALVHRIVVERGCAVGVGYSHDGGPPRRAYADSEVVLCAGVLGSPKALLLTGIGPSAHLEAVGVHPLVDLAGWGENLHDHPARQRPVRGRGAAAGGENNLLEAQLYARSIHCEGPAPDLQLLLIHIPYPADGYPVPEHGYTIAAGLVAPKSRGTLRRASTDPARSRWQTRTSWPTPQTWRRWSKPSNSAAISVPRGPSPRGGPPKWPRVREATTRAELREFLRRGVGTYHHQVGTCKMGAADDPMP
jgi:choline dehydrogenase